MIDQEDRQVLLQMGVVWSVRFVLGVMGVIGASLTFGLAWRLFEAVKG